MTTNDLLPCETDHAFYLYPQNTLYVPCDSSLANSVRCITIARTKGNAHINQNSRKINNNLRTTMYCVRAISDAIQAGRGQALKKPNWISRQNKPTDLAIQ
ncbi:MAG: hypothetical protein IT497_06470 [Ottowia sp.]|nr:hypothetical protein [Ottowia sp.]